MLRRLQFLCAISLVFMGRAHADYNAVVNVDAPDHYFHFNEAGSTASDNGFAAGLINGTYVATPTDVTGIPSFHNNGAKEFNGTTQYMTVVPTAGYSMPVTTNGVGFTTEIWVKGVAPLTAGALSSSLGSAGGAGVGFSYGIYGLTNNKFEYDTFQCSAAVYGSVTSVGSYTTGQWAHVVGTTLGSGSGLTHMLFYVDGALISTVTSFTGSLCTTLPPNVRWGADGFAGGGAPADFLHGDLDEGALYAKELSATRITAHRLAGITAGHGWWTGGSASRPDLPHFRDDDYFLRAAQYGYVTGHFAPSEMVPSLIPLGYQPLDVAPNGNIGRTKHLPIGASVLVRHDTPFERRARVLGLLPAGS